MEKTQHLMYIVLGSGACNIALNFLLAPRLGILAASVATFLSYLLYLIVVASSADRILTWSFPFASLGIVTASAVVAVYGIGSCVQGQSLPVQISAVILSLFCYRTM